MRHVSCILLLESSTTSQRLWVYRISVPYAQKDPRFLFEKRRGQPREFWSLVSTIDGGTLPQDCVEDLLCGTQRTCKTYICFQMQRISEQRLSPMYTKLLSVDPKRVHNGPLCSGGSKRGGGGGPGGQERPPNFIKREKTSHSCMRK